MKLAELLEQKRSIIQDRWVDLILETYPPDAKRFLGKQKDPFANPVGTTIVREIENIYGELLTGPDPERLAPCLDRIIRIRAVQEFTPSRAVSFVFLLKRAVRSVLEKEIRRHGLLEEWTVIESGIDEMAMLAFEIYMKCREKIYEIRAKEAKNQVSRLLRRAGLVSEIPEWDAAQRGR